jgi:hypothetical protein
LDREALRASEILFERPFGEDAAVDERAWKRDASGDREEERCLDLLRWHPEGEQPTGKLDRHPRDVTTGVGYRPLGFWN